MPLLLVQYFLAGSHYEATDSVGSRFLYQLPLKYLFSKQSLRNAVVVLTFSLDYHRFVKSNFEQPRLDGTRLLDRVTFLQQLRERSL